MSLSSSAESFGTGLKLNECHKITLTKEIEVLELQYLRSLKSFATAMLGLLSKSNANVTIHPFIANFFFMFPFLLERKKAPKKEKRGKFLILVSSPCSSTLCVYGHGDAPQSCVHVCVVVAVDVVCMPGLSIGTIVSPKKLE